jgi:hypothetical protein
MDTPMTPIEIDDVEISGVSSMPIDGRGGGGQPPLPKKRRNVTNKSAAWTILLGIKVLPIMIL